MTNTCMKCGKVFAHNEPVYMAYGRVVDFSSFFSDEFTKGGMGGSSSNLQILGLMCRHCYELSMWEANKNDE